MAIAASPWQFMALHQILSSVPYRIFLYSCRNRLINQSTFMSDYQNYKLHVSELTVVVF